MEEVVEVKVEVGGGVDSVRIDSIPRMKPSMSSVPKTVTLVYQYRCSSESI